MARKSLFDTMGTTYDGILDRLEAKDRARKARDAALKGTSMQETMENVHDFLVPEEAPPGRHEEMQARVRDAASPTITGKGGREVLVGADGDDLLEPYAPKYAPDFYDKIAEVEQSPGYGARNKESTNKMEWAWGRYQVLADNLRAMGLLDAEGNWTGMLGINDEHDFLSNKNQIQERAFDAYLEHMEGLNRRNLDAVGQINQRRILEEQPGVHPPLTITQAGLMAAAHRAGQGWVREYLRWLADNGWESFGKMAPLRVNLPNNRRSGQPYTQSEISDWFRRVETRLREFEYTPYTR